MNTPTATRDVFPFAPDREVIDAFLAGRAHLIAASTLHTAGKTLGFGDGTGHSATIAWYDTGGTLVAKIAQGQQGAHSVLVINHIMRTLGLPASQITREEHVKPGDRSLGERPWAYYHFFAEHPIIPDEPFTLCGPLGVAAYRVSVRP